MGDTARPLSLDAAQMRHDNGYARDIKGLWDFDSPIPGSVDKLDSRVIGR
jgi:hypothetical protein